MMDAHRVLPLYILVQNKNSILYHNLSFYIEYAISDETPKSDSFINTCHTESK